MTSLITLLISLIGYGTPADFDHFTETELQDAIEYVEDGGTWGDWDDSQHNPGDPNEDPNAQP